MTTIIRAVEKYLEGKPFIQDSLTRGIINYGTLADEILPEIEKDLRKKVKHSAVMMALRRLSESLKSSPVTDLKFSKETSLIVKEGLFELTVVKNKATLKKIRELFDKIDYGRGDFLTITQGMHEVTIISDEKNSSMIKKYFRKSDIITSIKNLSAISLGIPLEFTETPGFFYIVTKALSWENINVNEIVSTSRELTLIIRTDDVPESFKVLKNLVRRKK